MAPFLHFNAVYDEGTKRVQGVVDGVNDISVANGVQQTKRIEKTETNSQNGQSSRQQILVVGLGMVAISFMYVTLLYVPRGFMVTNIPTERKSPGWMRNVANTIL